MNREKLNDAFKFQESYLRKYASMNYEELEALKGRREIDSPAELEEFDFAIEIKPDEFGGLEVNVFHYFQPEMDKMGFMKTILEENNVSLGESKMCRWFNIEPNGKITWPSFEFEDGED